MKWSLLIISLSTQNATARMRAWRALKACGAAVLRDGVYLLPSSSSHEETLVKIEQDVVASGGSAYRLQVTDPAEYPFAELFDRTQEYQALVKDIHQLQNQMQSQSNTDFVRASRKLHQAFDGLIEIDFFPGEAQRQTLVILEQLDQSIRTLLFQNEPSAQSAKMQRLEVAQFQQRTWATRKRPWIDRLASAWLIHRYIDTQAQFLWLDSPEHCPVDALGFDFDGARFTHVETTSGTLVTFETLLMSFGKDTDVALRRLAQIVHALDVGGLPVAEASGLERLLGGMRNRITDDNLLLAAAEQTFDDLYSSFALEAKQHD